MRKLCSLLITIFCLISLTQISVASSPPKGDWAAKIADDSINQKAQKLFQSCGWKDFKLNFFATPLIEVAPSEWKALSKQAQKKGLKGAKSSIDGNQYWTCDYFDVAGYNQPYQIEFSVLFDKENKYIKAAWIELAILEDPIQNSYSRKKLGLNHTKSSTDQMVLSFYKKKRAAKPIDNTALAGSFGGYGATSKEQKELEQLFKKSKLKTDKLEFYVSAGQYATLFDESNTDNQNWDYERFDARAFSDDQREEIGLIAGDKDVANLDGFYYSEHKFAVSSNNKLKYYVDFCARKVSKNEFITWLVVKPAKLNQSRALDMFIYPIDTSRNEIELQVITYFKNTKSTK